MTTEEHTPILCVSDFCSQLRPVAPQEVRLKLISSSFSQKHDTASDVAWASLALFRRLSVRDGSLVWIQNQSSTSGVVSRLFLLDEDDDTAAECLPFVHIHPVTALNLHWTHHQHEQQQDHPNDNNNNDGISPVSDKEDVMAWVQPYHPASSTTARFQHLPVAHRVTLRPWGRLPHIPTLLGATQTRHTATLWPPAKTILQEGTLVMVCDDKKEENDGPNAPCYYEVVQVLAEDEEDAGDHSNQPPRQTQPQIQTDNDNEAPIAYQSTAQTAYRVETLPQPWTCPQLPSLLTNVMPPPHPSVDALTQALRIPATATAAQRVVVVVGTSEEHLVEDAVTTAAHAVGRTCLTVKGLAAHTYACRGTLTRAASLVDKLAGLRAALDQAYQAAPCVLHVCQMDLELTAAAHDPRRREDEESRFWSVLTADNQRQPPRSTSHRLPQVPSVLVVLSMEQPMSGPLVRHVTWEPIVLSRPDEVYIQYLWSRHSAGTSAAALTTDVASRLEGRTARAVVHLAQHVADDCGAVEGSNPAEVLDAHLATLDKAQPTSHIPHVTWSDVGGLDHVRAAIRDALELPLQHPEWFVNKTRGGLLLYGPPGTGKTLVAKAVANECQLPFVSVKGPELLGSYVGESEANVRAVFAQARALAAEHGAAVLFFDELDSLAPRRSDNGQSGASGVMDRVVATLWMELDRCGSVFCIGATNRPDLLDPALLRPGRLDRHVYLGMSSVDRAHILTVHLNKLQLEKGDTASAVAQRVLEHMEDSKAQHLSGADLASIASSALLLATQRVCDQAEAASQVQGVTVDHILAEWSAEQMEPVVRLEDLVQAANDVVPSVDEAQLLRYEELRNKMESGL